jgi:hypothetical protein
MHSKLLGWCTSKFRGGDDGGIAELRKLLAQGVQRALGNVASVCDQFAVQDMFLCARSGQTMQAWGWLVDGHEIKWCSELFGEPKRYGN